MNWFVKAFAANCYRLALVLAALAALSSVSLAEPPTEKEVHARGYVTPGHMIPVSGKVPGEVVQVFVEEGKLVKAGEVLARLDDARLRAEAEVARAALDVAKARLAELRAGPRAEEAAEAKEALEEAQERLKEDELERDRLEKLRSKNLVSETDWNRAESSCRQAKHRVERLRIALDLVKQGTSKERLATATAELKMAEARLAATMADVDSTVIRAPINGSILSKRVEVGSYVNPGAVGVSASICELADLRDLEVEVAVPEENLATVSKGQSCRIEIDAYRDVTYKGQVVRIQPVVDRDNHTVRVFVKLELPDKDERLRPGMTAKVHLVIKE